MFRPFLCIWIIISFLGNVIVPSQKAYAQGVLGLPEAGQMVNLSPAYEPVLIKGLRIDLENPLKLDFIVATGNSNLTINDPDLKTESEKLIKYFYAALTLPDKDVWVNLSPYEKDRIVPQATGETEMGRDMLAQDYILKQITASLIYPEKGLGKDFWDRVYKESYQRFGTARIPVNTFNKVWIVADKASVYESKNTVMVVDAHLKVMLEEDYLSLQKHAVIHNDSGSIGANVIRSIILPALEKEVNEGRNFADLRQIFHSIILAKWYKESLRTALLNQVYSNKNKISGVDVQDKTIKEKIYQRYLEAYKKGVFNYIKDDIDRATKRALPRKYFSGGISTAMKLHIALESQAMMSVREWLRVGTFFLVSSLANLSSADFYVGPHHPVRLPILHGLEKFYRVGGTIWFSAAGDYRGSPLAPEIIGLMGLPPGTKIVRMRNDRSTEALEGDVLAPGRRYEIDTTEDDARKAILHISQAMVATRRDRSVIDLDDYVLLNPNEPREESLALNGTEFVILSLEGENILSEKIIKITREEMGMKVESSDGSSGVFRDGETFRLKLSEASKARQEKEAVAIRLTGGRVRFLKKDFKGQIYYKNTAVPVMSKPVPESVPMPAPRPAPRAPKPRLPAKKPSAPALTSDFPDNLIVSPKEIRVPRGSYRLSFYSKIRQFKRDGIDLVRTADGLTINGKVFAAGEKMTMSFKKKKDANKSDALTITWTGTKLIVEEMKDFSLNIFYGLKKQPVQENHSDPLENNVGPFTITKGHHVLMLKVLGSTVMIPLDLEEIGDLKINGERMPIGGLRSLRLPLGIKGHTYSSTTALEMRWDGEKLFFKRLNRYKAHISGELKERNDQQDFFEAFGKFPELLPRKERGSLNPGGIYILPGMGVHILVEGRKLFTVLPIDGKIDVFLSDGSSINDHDKPFFRYSNHNMDIGVLRKDVRAQKVGIKIIFKDDSVYPKITYEIFGKADKTKPVDPAMNSKMDVSGLAKGGVDLDPSKFFIQRTGTGVDIKFDPAMMAQFREGDFRGIRPIVTGIHPIFNIYPLVGLREPGNKFLSKV